MKPILHLTNFASRQLHHGRVFSIMAFTPYWAKYDGWVQALAPHRFDLSSYQDGRIQIGRYRERYEATIEHLFSLDVLAPGRLCVPEDVFKGRKAIMVADGDTLCCTCSKEEAAAGRCHRAWAAPFLVRAGWNVVLDGVESKEGDR